MSETDPQVAGLLSVIFFFTAVGFIGYILNAIKFLAGFVRGGDTKTVIRMVGLFIPILGAVLGFF